MPLIDLITCEYVTPSIPKTHSTFKGQVIATDDHAYEKARTVFYSGIDRRLAVIIRVIDVNDISRVGSLKK